VGLFCSLFLLVISATGLGLSLKSRLDWMRPPTQAGGEIKGPEEIVGIDAVIASVSAQPGSGMKSLDDVRRLEYHAGDNVFKLIAKEGYVEVQVDGATGRVLGVGRRNDQLFEDIHDLSLFSDFTADFVLPAAAAGLFCLSLSGLFMFSVPIFRRMKHKGRLRQAQ
jgi:uncharacterized iron-regulated membrane protein